MFLLSVCWHNDEQKSKNTYMTNSLVVFLYCTCGQEGCLYGYGTIPIDTDDVRIDMSEHL